eukprot:GHRR01032188.1.p1 GENE.GHRR01032188.1~~GHRR01032188.1.p1  ORF type:complete len:158 (+),score=33.36 GHRR01032188.1:292-765(+)
MCIVRNCVLSLHHMVHCRCWRALLRPCLSAAKFNLLLYHAVWYMPWYYIAINAGEATEQTAAQRGEGLLLHKCCLYNCPTYALTTPHHFVARRYVVARNAAEAAEKAAAQWGAGLVLTQESDVLDTWFSSGLWPFSTLGWPDADAQDFKTFYPTEVG